MKLPREVTNAISEAETAYIITTQGDQIQSFLLGTGCQCCLADATIDAMLGIMQSEASDDTMPPIFTGLMETINHELNRQN